MARKIDRLFAIPDGVDWEYKKELNTRVITPARVQSAQVNVERIEDNTIQGEPQTNSRIDPPENFAIISQTVRTAPDGRQVVDIVAEITDARNAPVYEVRVNKV